MALMTIHELRIWPKYFEPLLHGDKQWELRKDRRYKVGDVLHLREWDEETGRFTGRSVRRRVTDKFAARSPRGLLAGYCILSLEDC